jgi:hypothetical protein
VTCHSPSYGYACNFSGLKINGMELNTGNILEENLVQFTFRQTLGDEFTFQQDNNLRKRRNPHTALDSIIALLTKALRLINKAY